MLNLFWIFLFDTVHHLGKLSTYYRLIEVANPHIYRPSAEDAQKMADSVRMSFPKTGLHKLDNQISVGGAGEEREYPPKLNNGSLESE